MIQFNAHTGSPPMDLSFELETGRLGVLYGPTGSGKTTLLRMIAGLTSAGKGSIVVDGQTWEDRQHQIFLPPQQRSISMVFQDFALFPHLTVRDNIAFALPKKEDPKQIDDLLDSLSLRKWAHRKPALLSGGQQQRVALGRALARRPRILLLDEALSAQDNDMRQRLQTYLLSVHKSQGMTTLLATHNLPEALRLGDHLLCMESGKIVQEGDPRDILGKKYDVY